MLKGLGDVGNLMKMQKEMKGIQKKIKKMKAEGESPGGDVKAVVNGEFELLDISIDNDFMKSHENKKVEKMILAAVNDAMEKVRDESAAEMQKITGDMDLGGMFK
ncbi:MAG: YbaB/EbfC family nucleoid-associated protein [bacterium]|nr:YbaB/EbfC family nucleoid-associated protein [bacterium]